MGNKTTKRALASAAAMCLVLSSAPTFAAETTVPETTELSGKGRIQTAIRIAEEGWKGEFKGSKNAVLTAGADANLVDALAVSPLAYKLKAPILLNDAKDTINADTLKALKDNGVTKVYLATGEGVISNKVVETLKAEKIEVERLGGKNRYETAKNILNAFKNNGGKDNNLALVADNGLADALSVSSIAAKKGMPIVLTEGKDKVAAGLDEIVKAAEKVYAIGGTGVISDVLVNQIKADRLGGNNRYETNAAVIKAFAEAKSVSFDKVYLANGQNGHLVDALTGSVLAAQSSSAIVLGDDGLNDKTAEILTGKVNGKSQIIELGGAVNEKFVEGIAEVAKAAQVKVEAVKAINETAVQVTGLSKETKEEDLKGKQITLKAGDVELTATYVATSLTQDGKANFVLDSEKKLTDAAIYTVSADWASFTTDTFMAKVAATTYINKVEAITKAVPAGNNSSVYFTAKDQYGENIDLKGKTSDLNVKGTLNGVPFLSTELTSDKENGMVKITKDLKEGDKVTLTFTNKIGEKTVEVGSVSYTVVKAEAAVATTVSNMTATYVGSVNEHKDGEEAKEVLPGDTVKLTVKVSDQFGNPMDTSVRWVVEEGKDLTDANVSVVDAVDFTFKAVKAGNVKISAYNLSNGAKATYEVTVGAKKLTALNLVDEAGTRYNQDENIVKVVTPNEGAKLTADMIKFDVKATKTTVDVTPADVQVTAKARSEVDKKAADNKNDIVIVVKSTKPGKYTITPYVGESLEKATAKATGFNVTTTIDITVTSIDDIAFDAKELKTGKEIKKDVTFRNKHGEVVVVNNPSATVVTPVGNVKAVVSKDVTDAKNPKNILTLSEAKEGTCQVTINENNVIKSFTLTFTAPTFTKIDAGADITGVVAGDPVDKAKYQTVKFLDQDNKEMAVKKSDLKVSVTKPDGQSLTDVDLGKLITLGKTYSVSDKGVVTFNLAGKDDNVVAYKILPDASLVQGVYTVKIANADGKIADTFAVTVGAARVNKTVEVTPASTNVALKGKVKVKITPKDQYGEFIKEENIVVNAGDYFKASTISEVTNDDGDLIAYEVTLTATTKGTNDVVVNVMDKIGEDAKVISTNKVSMTVDSVANLVNSVAIDTTGIKALYSTEVKNAEVTLKAIAKDANGNVVPVDGTDLNWSVAKVTAAKDDSTGTVNVDANGKVIADKGFKGSAVIKVVTANMKEATITLNFDKAPAAPVTGTTKVVNPGKDMVVDADETKPGIQVLFDGNGKNDGEVERKIKFKVTAKDQYGNDIANLDLSKAVVLADDASVLENPALVDADDTITLTAKAVGTTNVYIQFNGDTIKLEVSVNQAALENVKEAN